MPIRTLQAVGNKKELDVYGSHLGPYTYPLAIDLMARGELRKPCHRRDPRDQGGHTTMTGPLEAGRR